MPTDVDFVTDSWRAYQDCMRSIQDFLHQVTVRDSEVWVGNVCLGSPDHSWVRVPLQVDSAELVHRALERAQDLIAAVRNALHSAVEASNRVMKEVRDKGVDQADLTGVIARTDSLRQLLNELMSVPTQPIGYHPAVLIRWSEILRRSLVRGDAAVKVRVVTMYVL